MIERAVMVFVKKFRMCLGMSLPGLYNVGCDKSDPDLFVRWVQNGIMYTRFTIHSWNDDYTVN